MTALEHNFNCRASSGVCDLCGKSTRVIADMMSQRYKCFECLIRENREYAKQEMQRKRIPLNLGDFIAI